MSTDFEVHRNWLSITSNRNGHYGNVFANGMGRDNGRVGLGMTEWYFDESSPNATLDYPPLFALFEMILSRVVIDGILLPLVCALTSWNASSGEKMGVCERLTKEMDSMLDLKGGVGYRSQITVLVHRLTVMLADVLLYVALVRFMSFWWSELKMEEEEEEEEEEETADEGMKSNDKEWSWSNRTVYLVVLALLFMAPGLIMVDHIHFQYNGFLFGFLIFCVSFIQEGRYLLGGATFAILLMLKHIFIYMIPAVFLFLLFEYCYNKEERHFSVARFLTLGVSVMGIFGLSFTPFVIDFDRLTHTGDMKTALNAIVPYLGQIFARMFPFQRGLTHSYWAPNVWALYNSLDKLLHAMLNIVRPMSTQGTVPIASLTGGLVGLDQGSHIVLFPISPQYTIILSLIVSLLICSIVIYRRWSVGRSNIVTLLICLTHSSFSFFMFGWHVHEKAILMVLLPLSLLPIIEYCQPRECIGLQSMRWFAFISIVGSYSLFPLLYPLTEALTRNLVLISHVLVLILLSVSTGTTSSFSLSFSRLERVYLAGLALVELFSLASQLPAQLQPPFLSRFPFLPLLITSLYCAQGLIYAWIRMLQFHTKLNHGLPSL